ncbi:FxSxx-COOH system tetratricopeptide repeat protein [Streptomyces achromogenes]|uniref:FxSxx-COOH system tetratricopeptide repeat protein n=1 Tax=Streptomyces achromogenes TaxID=67255 RepID=UPI0036A7ECCB
MPGDAFYGPVAAQYGDHNQQNNYLPPRTPAAWPHQVGVIPPRAQWFQNRAETHRLAQALTAGGTAVVESTDRAPELGLPGGVLAGMGGVGKTQLAADYARTSWQAGELDVLVWITASNRTAAASGYAQAAVELLAADPGDEQAAAREFLAWLEPKPGQPVCRWLVVLDDIGDPADLHGLWPPASPHGRTVATTRRKDAALTGQGRRLIEIGLFTKAQALAYLTNALAGHGRSEPGNDLAALANDLGYLPLALSQTVAYLIDTGITSRAYRALLADRTRTLADTAPDTLPDDQTYTVAAAWSLSIDRADTLRPPGLARPVLQLAAFLDPNGIPDTVLTSPPALAHLTDQHTATTPGATGPVNPEQVALALSALRRLSLIEHTPTTPHQAVRVHQLIQHAVRDTLTPDQHHHLARTAADALLAAWPDNEYGTVLAQVLRANTTVLAGHAEQALYQPDAHKVLYEAGSSLGGVGQATAATDYFRRLAQTTTRYLGPDSYFTLGARHKLAQWQGWAGDAAGAAAAYAELLDDMIRVLGPDHPDTILVRCNLAHFRGESGDVAGAAAAFAELLDDMIRVCGPHHPDTFAVRHNLATRRTEAGDVEGAAAAFAELLDDMIRVLGPDHHAHTLGVRHNLAYLQLDVGDVEGAAAAFAELLDDMIRVCGPHHPDTLTVRHSLARSQGEAGDVAGAAAAFAELLDDSVRVLGPDHPDTLIVRNDLAIWQGEAGDAAGAAAAFAELLDDSVRVLGPDHPNTLTARNNLARWQGQAADTGVG